VIVDWRLNLAWSLRTKKRDVVAAAQNSMSSAAQETAATIRKKNAAFKARRELGTELSVPAESCGAAGS
jgi:hypothetical protein